LRRATVRSLGEPGPGDPADARVEDVEGHQAHESLAYYTGAVRSGLAAALDWPQRRSIPRSAHDTVHYRGDAPRGRQMARPGAGKVTA